MSKILYRPVTGTLEEAMKQVVEIDATKDALAAQLAKVYGREPPRDRIAVTFYKHDDRVNWRTYLVTVNGKPCGITNGPVT